VATSCSTQVQQPERTLPPQPTATALSGSAKTFSDRAATVYGTEGLRRAGDPAGRPVLVHLGNPDSRHLYDPWVAMPPGEACGSFVMTGPDMAARPPAGAEHR